MYFLSCEEIKTKTTIVMYHLLSLKCISASYEVVHVSLDGPRRNNTGGNQQPCTLQSTLDIYAEWKNILQVK